MDHQRLIDDHWSYIEEVLEIHRVGPSLAREAYRDGMRDGLLGRGEKNCWMSDTTRFHYRTARKHGLNHREADMLKIKEGT